MKTRIIIWCFALIIVLNIADGVFAIEVGETWDEITVSTFFDYLNIDFPNLFKIEDPDFVWTENGPKNYEKNLPKETLIYSEKETK